MVMERLSSLKKKTQDNILSLLKNDKNKIAALIGAIIGGDTQEGNENELFTIPIGMAIGAMTGAGLTFSSPVVINSSLPEERSLLYNTNKEQREESLRFKNFFSKINNLKDKIKKSESKVESLSERIISAKNEKSKKGLSEKIERENNRISRYKNRLDKSEKGISDAISYTSKEFNDSDSLKFHSILNDNGIDIKNGLSIDQSSAIMSSISGHEDFNFAKRAENMIAINLESFKKFGEVLDTGYSKDLNMNIGLPINKSEAQAKITKKTNTIVNNMSDQNFDEMINSILKQNNTPDNKISGIKSAISKIRKHSIDNNQKMLVSNNSISTSFDGKTLSYPLVKYSEDSASRFVETNNGTRFIAKQFNPLGSLLSNQIPFNFEQTGRTSNAIPRVPTSKDIVESYDPIEAVNFFGVNEDSSNVAKSLTQYIAKEDILKDENYEGYKTRLGAVTGKQIELKHTVKPQSISPIGNIVDTSIGEILEVPKNGIQSEIKTIVDSLIKDFPERVLYGEDGTTRKTSITSPNSYSQKLISPIPNAARGGQGVTNRGKNSEVKITKKIISGKNTTKAMPYLFGSHLAFGDGSTLFDERIQVGMSEYGKLEIAPNRNGEFNLSIFGIDQIKHGLTISDDSLRKEYFDKIEFNSTAKKSLFNTVEKLERDGDRIIHNTGVSILKMMDSGKITIGNNETVGLSPEGNQVKILKYYTHANIVDAKINEDGNLSLEYEGHYNPSVGGDIKILSQSTKSAGLKISRVESNIFSGLDFLESKGIVDYTFSEDGVLQYLTFNKKPLGNELSLGGYESREFEGLFKKGSDKIIVSPSSYNHPAFQVVDIIGEKIREKNNYDLLFPISETSIGDIYNIGNTNVSEVIGDKNSEEYKSINKQFNNYGIMDFSEYRHESEDLSLKDRIQQYTESYRNGSSNSVLTPEEFAKKELTTESLYQMYTSENKAAPDIHEMILGEEANTSPYIETKESVQGIVDKKLLLSEDKNVRVDSSKKIRRIIRSIVDNRDDTVLLKEKFLELAKTNPLYSIASPPKPHTIDEFFSPVGKLLNQKSTVAIEEGLEIHGVGNPSRFSWIGLYQMLENKIDKGTLETIADYDSEALHELEMIRGNSSTSTSSHINTGDLNKKQLLQINNALSSDSEFRYDNIKSILPDVNINRDDGVINFNLSKNTGDLRSIGFSTFKTGRSGSLSFKDKEILTGMDKAKLDILNLDIQLGAEKEGTEIHTAIKKDLDSAVFKYKKLVSQAMQSDGSSNILKRANSMIAKNSEIRAAKPVGGYVADVIVPRLREESGTRGSYNVYTMDAYNEIMEKFNLNPDEHFLQEVSNENDFNVSFHDGSSSKNTKTPIYRLMRKYGDDSMPVYDITTREPAFGPQSTMIKEILVSDENSRLPDGKKSYIVGIPQTKDKTVESIYQKQDFDQDTLGVSLVSLDNKEEQEKIMTIKRELDKRVTEDFDFQQKLDIKSKNKRMISVQQMLNINEKTGVPLSKIWTMEETALAQKGTLRKTATPFVSSLGLSIRDSITANRIAGKISEDEAFTARSLMYTIEENILKTQHEKTEKAVAPIPEIFKLIESRKEFLKNNITEKEYRNKLENTISHYIHLDSTDPNELSKLNKGVSALIDSDILFARRLNGVSKTVLSVSSDLSDRAIESNLFFRNLSQTLTDVMFDRIGGKTIFKENMETAIPESVSVNSENQIESFSKKMINVKNVVQNITTGKNLKRISIGALGLAGTTIVLGRNNTMPSSLDVGQDAEKDIKLPEVQQQNTGYLSSDKINKGHSVKISGLQKGIPSEKINRLVYGNNISTNRVRDDRK